MIDFDSFIGGEQIQRSAMLALFDGLNDALTLIQTEFDISDQAFATRTGRTYAPIELEPVAPENFYEGHIPSLIKAPVDKYPNVSVFVNRNTPAAGSDQLDQMDAFHTALIVELMAKSINSEEEVDKRIKRMVEGVNYTFKQNPTLGGDISGFQPGPTVIYGEVFLRSEKTAYGPKWFWQGARMEYVVRKNSVSPNANFGQGGGPFALPFGANIDQG